VRREKVLHVRAVACHDRLDLPEQSIGLRERLSRGGPAVVEDEAAFVDRRHEAPRPTLREREGRRGRRERESRQRRTQAGLPLSTRSISRP